VNDTLHSIETVEEEDLFQKMLDKARTHLLEVMFLIGCLYAYPLRGGLVSLNLVSSCLHNIIEKSYAYTINCM